MQQYLSIPAVYRWLITILFVGLVVILSVTPGRAQPGDSIFVWLVVNTPTPLQKFMHVAIYAALALLLMWSLEAIESLIARIGLTFVLTVSLGAVLEWYQTLVPGRFGTIIDALLNAIGVVVGLLLASFLL
ncbi:MAG: VanZ family protein [Gammaproteobacteria bacterium]|nr:VanZ family protein [Gammaproteobacteria bacterium]MDH3468211.1 VanZ family protein [Gammaproteobacteria bacterium]